MTAKQGLSVLERSGIVALLRPYRRNNGKRLVKTSKLHFPDSEMAERVLARHDLRQIGP